MGLSEIFQQMLSGNNDRQAKKGPIQKCPSCGETITLDMERCPKCGVRVKSMFRRKCPKCETLNELDAKRCTQCNYDFEAELARAKKTYYRCPICGFQMEGFLIQCPACNTRFM